MANLDAIRTLISVELEKTNTLIKSKIASDIPLAKAIADHIIKSPGKQVRPMLVLLSAKACGTLDDRAITLAAIIELLHTATLLHDDVIDESKQRRGRPTANEHFGNEASVLVGDLLYARAFEMIASLNHAGITQIIANATGQIVEGEVLQLMHCHDSTTDEATYLEIVKRKTGMLFEIAALSGPILANLDSNIQQALRDYGQHLGTAFQILDDALDYEGDAETIGKNLGDDLQEGKPTLPLIYVMKHGHNEDKKFIAEIIKNPKEERLQDVQRILEKSQSITYCKELAHQKINLAIDELSCLEESHAKNALVSLAEFVVARNH